MTLAGFRYRPGAADLPGDATALLSATRDQGYEGIALKRPASLYYPRRRTRGWLKIRHIRAIDVHVGGWLPGNGARSRLAGSVLMGIPGRAGLEFAGAVGSGLFLPELRELTTMRSHRSGPHRRSADRCPRRSRGTRGGPGPTSSPTSPTWSAPLPGGCASRCGAAVVPVRVNA